MTCSTGLEMPSVVCVPSDRSGVTGTQVPEGRSLTGNRAREALCVSGELHMHTGQTGGGGVGRLGSARAGPCTVVTWALSVCGYPEVLSYF